MQICRGCEVVPPSCRIVTDENAEIFAILSPVVFQSIGYLSSTQSISQLRNRGHTTGYTIEWRSRCIDPHGDKRDFDRDFESFAFDVLTGY